MNMFQECLGQRQEEQRKRKNTDVTEKRKYFEKKRWEKPKAGCKRKEVKAWGHEDEEHVVLGVITYDDDENGKRRYLKIEENQKSENRRRRVVGRDDLTEVEQPVIGRIK